MGKQTCGQLKKAAETRNRKSKAQCKKRKVTVRRTDELQWALWRKKVIRDIDAVIRIMTAKD